MCLTLKQKRAAANSHAGRTGRTIHYGDDDSAEIFTPPAASVTRSGKPVVEEDVRVVDFSDEE